MSTWENRWHPFLGEWILFTAHRGSRPWLGETSAHAPQRPPSYDPECALCPGNKRLKGTNPDYSGAYWFANDLPCFSDDAPGATEQDPVYRTKPALGGADVICYHPDHGKTFADLNPEEAAGVVALWTERTTHWRRQPGVESVLVFENRGKQVGVSNPHPHCQIYAASFVYRHFAREAEVAIQHHGEHGRSILKDVVAREQHSPRQVFETEHFIATVPWFAKYAYEMHLLPKMDCGHLGDLSDAQSADLGRAIARLARTYDALWDRQMPYVMAIHQAPVGMPEHRLFPFHVEFHPPLRTPDTLKYLAGPEVGGGSMTNESDPDAKAGELRAAAGKADDR